MSLFFQVAEVEAGEGVYEAAGGGVQDLYTAALSVCLDIEVTLEGYGVVLVDFVKTDVLEDLFSSTQFFIVILVEVWLHRHDTIAVGDP